MTSKQHEGGHHKKNLYHTNLLIIVMAVFAPCCFEGLLKLCGFQVNMSPTSEDVRTVTLQPLPVTPLLFTPTRVLVPSTQSPLSSPATIMVVPETPAVTVVPATPLAVTLAPLALFPSPLVSLPHLSGNVVIPETPLTAFPATPQVVAPTPLGVHTPHFGNVGFLDTPASIPATPLAVPTLLTLSGRAVVVPETPFSLLTSPHYIGNMVIPETPTSLAVPTLLTLCGRAVVVPETPSLAVAIPVTPLVVHNVGFLETPVAPLAVPTLLTLSGRVVVVPETP